MSWAFNHAVYCAYCGGPLDYQEDHDEILYQDVCQLEGPSYDEHGNKIPYQGPWLIAAEEMKWLADIHLIGRAANREHCAEFLRYRQSETSDFFIRPALWEGVHGVIMSDDKTRKITEVYFHRPELGDLADFPVHVACLSIAERVTERRRRQEKFNKPTSLEEMYDAINSDSRHGPSEDLAPALTCWSHNYYGAGPLQGQSWSYDLDDGTEWLCADSLNIPSLTTYILRHVRENGATEAPQGPHCKALAQPSLTESSTLSRLESLPVELVEKVSSFLPFSSVLSLSRTSKRLHERVLSQKLWRDALVAGDAVGYLWDLDESACRAGGRGRIWDWRELARALARRDCFDPGNGFDDAPRGLRNRQRIWKILVDA